MSYSSVLLSLLSVTTWVSAQSHIMTLRGDPYLGIGVHVASVDLDRDGHIEVMFAADFKDVHVHSGRTGMEMLRIKPPFSPTLFVVHAQSAGDVNDDRIPDIVLADLENSRLASRAGAILWFSGKDGTLLRAFYHDSVDDVLGGIALTVVGDTDADGVADVAVAGRGPSASGIVLLLSGRNASVVHRWQGSLPSRSLGQSIAPAGDIDRDGHADFVMGDLRELIVVTGKSGNVLRRISIPQAEYLGARADLGDVDGDGWSDLAAQALLENRNHVIVVSGRTGTILRVWRGDWLYDGFGDSVAATGDVDGDGAADLVVGSPAHSKYPTFPSYARVLSGGSGKTLLTITETQRILLAAHVASGDVDGDGTPDVILGAPGDVYHPTLRGSVRIHSCRTLPLSTDTHLLSVATGGSQRFDLEGGAPLAGSGYLLLGTHSGTRPGLDLGSVRLPLNPDGYFAMTLAEPNRLIVNSLGVLDAQGRATATLRLPPLQPSLQGTLLHHAWLGFRLAPWRLGPASNPVPLTLVR